MRDGGRVADAGQRGGHADRSRATAPRQYGGFRGRGRARLVRGAGHHRPPQHGHRARVPRPDRRGRRGARRRKITSAATSCWWRPAGLREPTRSASTRWGSVPGRGSPSMTPAGSRAAVTGSTRPGISITGRCSPTWASTRGAPAATRSWHAPRASSPATRRRGRSFAATADHAAIPQVIFTDPEVSAVGLTHSAAVAAGLDVRAVDYEIGDVSGAGLLADGYTGHARMVVDEDRKVIVGVTFTGTGRRRPHPRRHGRGGRRGAARPPLARRPVLPDGERDLAAPAGDLRPVGQLPMWFAGTAPILPAW